MNKPTLSSSKTSLANSVPQGVAVMLDPRLREAQAQILSQYQMALMLQRDWDSIGAKLLLACQDPDFAREAYYQKTVDDRTYEGLSIRFAEEAMRLMRNVRVSCVPQGEDDLWAHFQMTVLDTESNTESSEVFKVSRVVERSSLREHDQLIGERTDNNGEKVYLVRATDEHVHARERSQAARVRRGLLTSIIPANIRAQCLASCKEVALAADSKDPAHEAKTLILAFVGIGVEVSDLKEYLGKSPTGATPSEIEQLRSAYALIRDGEQTWSDVMAAKGARTAAKNSKAALVAQKEKERAAKKPKATGQAAGAPRAPRGRKAAATATATTDAGAEVGATVEASVVAPPKPPRASRRGDDDDDDLQNTEAATSTTAPS